MFVVSMPGRRLRRRRRQQVVRCTVERLELRLVPSLFTVNSIDDTSDGVCDAQHCSLREAIEAANANSDADVIQFAISSGGVPTIQPAGELPAITAPVTIDGTTQPAGRVELDGSNAGDATGLKITGGDSTISGLVINRFMQDGIRLASDGNRIVGSLIGTDATGTSALGNGKSGVNIQSAAGNTIGGATEAERNIISGNQSDGIDIEGRPAASGGSSGAYFFTDFTGGAPPQFSGVTTTEPVQGFAGLGTAGNVFGGDFLRNTTAASVPAGGTASMRTTLTLTGLPAHQTIDLHFLFAAIDSWDTGSSGGPDFFEVEVDGMPIFRDNFANGAAPNPDVQGYNPPPGVALSTRPFSDLGFSNAGDSAWNLGLDPAFDNIPHSADTLTIAWLANGCCWSGSADESWGIDNVEVLLDSNRPPAVDAGNVVIGNFIGTDATGAAALGNAMQGIAIFGGAQQNRIGTNSDGTDDAGERNVISGNVQGGVFINGAMTDQNLVAGNFIGTDATGTTAVANVFSGVFINGGAQRNRVGSGTGVAGRNILSGNTLQGVGFSDMGTERNVVAGNFIGTDVTGRVALPNSDTGIAIFSGARLNLIGTDGDGVTDVAERNVVSGNHFSGVAILGAGADDNIVAGNYLGLDETGSAALGNGANGVVVFGGAQRNRIGTNGDGAGDAAERNVLSANNFAGVFIFDAGSDSNIVAGNFIGTDASGLVALGNMQHGVAIERGPQQNRVGTNGDGVADVAERNVISGNQWSGVSLFGQGTSQNIVAGNLIGVDVTELAALGNQNHGVVLFGGPQDNRIGTNGDGVADVAERNVISANAFSGVGLFDAETSFNTVAGNWIGTDSIGTADLGNRLDGVVFVNATMNTVGGIIPNLANTIAFNGQVGVDVYSGTANSILGNRIFSNIGLGIDLDSLDGVTPNDKGDRDGGANERQNFPVLSAISNKRGVVGLRGSLSGKANTIYRLEFFTTTLVDASGHGEGDAFLFATTVRTKKKGTAAFTLAMPPAIQPGSFITATASEFDGNTSEFSAGLRFVQPVSVAVARAAHDEAVASFVMRPRDTIGTIGTERKPQLLSDPAETLLAKPAVRRAIKRV